MVDMIKDNGNKWQRAYRNLLDRSTPLTVQRWLFTAAVLFVFAGVVVIRQGWYIVCYALAIYLLNLFLAFLQPRFDPSLQADLAAEDVEEGAPGLPGGDKKRQAGGGLSGLLSGFQPDGEEEFRPFIRRLPGESPPPPNKGAQVPYGAGGKKRTPPPPLAAKSDKTGGRLHR